MSLINLSVSWLNFVCLFALFSFIWEKTEDDNLTVVKTVKDISKAESSMIL